MLRRIWAVVPVVLLTPWLLAQQSQPSQPSSPLVIPLEAAKQPNPVKPTAESLARGKKWWGMDCAMCHGQNGDGKGETARDMKLAVPDFTADATLKDRTDGQMFYIIKNGHQDMPPEGVRLKTDEYWDLVNYVRSFVKAKPAEAKPAEDKNKN